VGVACVQQSARRAPSSGIAAAGAAPSPVAWTRIAPGGLCLCSDPGYATHLIVACATQQDAVMSIVDSARKALVPIHREGYPFIAIAAVATVILAMIWSPLGWIGAILTAWVCYFFRDPPRVTPIRDGLVVSPADGEVSMIVMAEPPPEPCVINPLPPGLHEAPGVPPPEPCVIRPESAAIDFVPVFTSYRLTEK